MYIKDVLVIQNGGFMHPYNEAILGTSPLDIKIGFHTRSEGYSPLHWHEALEILYPLNGESDIFIEGTPYHQKNKQLLVVDSNKVHSTEHKGNSAMFLCIHITKKSLEWYFPKIQDYRVCCYPDMVTDELFPVYLSMCQCLKSVTELYMKNIPTFLLESEGLVLQVISNLILHFANDSVPLSGDTDKFAMNRIRDIIGYVEAHFTEPVCLQDVADLLGIGKEYFCRFFKKNMGISFLNYLNQVRAAHIYHDLIHTDDPVQVVMEKNGFTNQKLFNKTFKILYGCTPSQIRKTQPTQK